MASSTQAITVWNSVEKIDKNLWNDILNYQNVYLSIPYLDALEKGLEDIDFRYVLLHEAGEVIGIAYFQLIRITSTEINTDALKEKMGRFMPSHFINGLDIGILICGNAFATGENGYIFKEGAAHQNVKISNCIDIICKELKKHGKKVSLSMVKEFWPENFSQVEGLKKFGYADISIDVNMIIHLKPEWKTFEDYLGAMNSKFRTKAKQVMKKSADIKVVNFDMTSLDVYLGEIDHLYNQLVDKANFSFGRLNARTLMNMKKVLGKHFLFKGYFIKEKLIGFSTATSFGQVLDGNYIGLDYDFNHEFSVYQRMLYDFVQHALDHGLTEIKIGRTAEEIKSGVGALPTEMKFGARHRNKLTNAILRPFVQRLEPSKFDLRKPFKAEYYT